MFTVLKIGYHLILLTLLDWFYCCYLKPSTFYLYKVAEDQITVSFKWGHSSGVHWVGFSDECGRGCCSALQSSVSLKAINIIYIIFYHLHSTTILPKWIKVFVYDRILAIPFRTILQAIKTEIWLIWSKNKIFAIYRKQRSFSVKNINYGFVNLFVQYFIGHYQRDNVFPFLRLVITFVCSHSSKLNPCGQNSSLNISHNTAFIYQIPTSKSSSTIYLCLASFQKSMTEISNKQLPFQTLTFAVVRNTTPCKSFQLLSKSVGRAGFPGGNGNRTSWVTESAAGGRNTT